MKFTKSWITHFILSFFIIKFEKDFNIEDDTEAVARCFIKNVFVKKFANSQQNICDGLSLVLS